MKNIHLIPTPNPSRLLKTIPKGNLLLAKENIVGSHWENQNIYITSDDEIKERDWCNDFDGKQILQFNNKVSVLLANQQKEKCGIKSFFKIILTTDQDLIKDGVQAIDDEFLEWFVNNPSCEEVEVEKGKILNQGSYITGNIVTKVHYEIIIPKEEPKQIKCYCGHTIYCDCGPLEEPKQETLEEAAEKYADFSNDYVPLAFGSKFNETTKRDFIAGAKWQQERMFSKEDIENIWNEFVKELPPINNGSSSDLLDYIKRFKKK